MLSKKQIPTTKTASNSKLELSRIRQFAAALPKNVILIDILPAIRVNQFVKNNEILDTGSKIERTRNKQLKGTRGSVHHVPHSNGPIAEWLIVLKS